MSVADAVFATETLALTVDGHVAQITLTRPELMNAFDEPLHVDFPEALRQLGPDVRALVLASEGKVFSAGGDFDFMKQAHADPLFLAHHIEIARDLIMTLVDTRVPVVAALHGAAMGLGATVVLACDCVVAARSATIADPHVQIGLAAGDGGCLFWPLAAGMMRARRYLLTGDRITGEQAYDFGLATDLVDTPEEVLPAAQALAKRMAALPPMAVQATKRALTNVVHARAAEVVDIALIGEQRTGASDDLLEAIAAFKERRPGNYTGR